MPIFEYICEKCDHRFEALVYGTKTASCPKCASSRLRPKLSVFSVSAKSSTDVSNPSTACGSCGDPHGPGSCAIPDFD